MCHELQNSCWVVFSHVINLSFVPFVTLISNQLNFSFTGGGFYIENLRHWLDFISNSEGFIFVSTFISIGIGGFILSFR